MTRMRPDIAADREALSRGPRKPGQVLLDSIESQAWKSQAIPDSLDLRHSLHARSNIVAFPGLDQDRADLNEPRPQRTDASEGNPILIKAGSNSHSIAKEQSAPLERIINRAPPSPARRPQGKQRQLMGNFGRKEMK